MASLAQIERALNGPKTYGVAQVAIGEVLNAIGGAYRLPELHQPTVNALDAARKPLEAWYAEIAGKDPSALYPEFQARRNLITRGYVEIAGAEGQSGVTVAESIGDELLAAVEELPATVGNAVGVAARGVGNVAGGVVGGLLSGIGPFLLLVIVVALVFGQQIVPTALRSIGVKS